MFKKILCISAHTDDIEHGCGSSIAKFIEQGIEVHCVSFSFCKESIPENFPQDITKKEFYKSMSVMGINDIITFNYPVRYFFTYRQAILENLVQIKKDLSPDLIFVPSTYDTHQDHAILNSETFRAFKESCILGYEMPRNNKSFSTDFFIKVEQRHILKKIEAIKCYESQKSKNSYNTDLMMHLAQLRGFQIGVDYAESFELIRYII